jgi:multidrug efflux pump subunit AcrA (membrane-fusion protein)
LRRDVAAAEALNAAVNDIAAIAPGDIAAGGPVTTFASREVRLGLQSGDFVLVLSGLKPGERVAAEGAIELLAPPP